MQFFRADALEGRLVVTVRLLVFVALGLATSGAHRSATRWRRFLVLFVTLLECRFTGILVDTLRRIFFHFVLLLTHHRLGAI